MLPVSSLRLEVLVFEDLAPLDPSHGLLIGMPLDPGGR